VECRGEDGEWKREESHQGSVLVGGGTCLEAGGARAMTASKLGLVLVPQRDSGTATGEIAPPQTQSRLVI
jgi:hypothetical protein